MPESSTDAAAGTRTTGRPSSAGTSPPRRINVAVTPDMLAAIDRVIEREQVTLTEAVRRLIGYGDVLFRAVKEDGVRVVFRSGNGDEREIVII